MENLFITKLVKIGTSKGVVVPSAICDAYNWKRGDTLLFVFTSENALTIRRVTDKEMREIKDRMRVIDGYSNEEIHEQNTRNS